MSGFEFDSFSEGEWENHEDLAWNEFDWQQYLKQSESEVDRFLDYFHQLKSNQNHLDEIAHRMGWDGEDWSCSDFSDEDLADEDVTQPALDNSFDPYTVHKHPVYIVTHGLYKNLFKQWEQFTIENQRALSPFFASQFSNSLHMGEFHAIMALNALDMADYNLTVCHLKNAMSAINQTLNMAQSIPAQNAKPVQLFFAELKVCIFDLREIWLRVMTDCREEYKRRRNDGDT